MTLVGGTGHRFIRHLRLKFSRIILNFTTQVLNKATWGKLRGPLNDDELGNALWGF